MDGARGVARAIDRLLRTGERRAKLLGLDAPAQAQAGVAVRYEVVGVDVAQPTRLNPDATGVARRRPWPWRAWMCVLPARLWQSRTLCGGS